MSGHRIRDDRERWREALERMGLDYVRQTLRERPDRSPDDIFHGLVPTPPFPTRRFVQEWVLDQENRIFRFTKPTILIIVAAVLVIVLAYLSTSSIQNALPPPPQTIPPAVQAQQQNQP